MFTVSFSFRKATPAILSLVSSLADLARDDAAADAAKPAEVLSTGKGSGRRRAADTAAPESARPEDPPASAAPASPSGQPTEPTPASTPNAGSASGSSTTTPAPAASTTAPSATPSESVKQPSPSAPAAAPTAPSKEQLRDAMIAFSKAHPKGPVAGDTVCKKLMADAGAARLSDVPEAARAGIMAQLAALKGKE
jgi:hypothetical protein